jgi:hypothetical protein
VDWTATVTAIGTVLGGLALPLAFIQLGAQRTDRLSAQVSKIGVWNGEAEALPTNAQRWNIPVFVRNSSELPVFLQAVTIGVQPSGRPRYQPVNLPIWETIAPGKTWEGASKYPEDPKDAVPEQPTALIDTVALIDAAGHWWEIRPYTGGAPRRVDRRRWWRKRHGDR